jgi:hypothetical protein
MNNLIVWCIEIFPIIFFIFKIQLIMIFVIFLQLEFHLTLKSLNFSLNFLIIHMFKYIYKVVY